MLYLYSFLTTKGIAIPQGRDTDHRVTILLYLQPESTVTVLYTCHYYSSTNTMYPSIFDPSIIDDITILVSV